MIIPQYDQRCKLGLGNFDLRVEVQGTLLSVRLIKSVTRQQKNSIQDDEDKEYRRTRTAIRKLVSDGAHELDYHLIQFQKQKALFLDYDAPPARRSSITTFSKKSRLRLLRTCSKLDLGLYGLFLTFTYRQNMTDARIAKEHLEKLSLWLKRNYPSTAFIWRMEFQERGAIHFHVVALNRAFIPAKKLTAYWQKLTRDDSYPDIKKLRSRRKVMFYVSKYIAKVTQTPTIHAVWVTEGSPVVDEETGEITRGKMTEAEQAQLVALDERIAANDSGKDIGLDSVPYSDNFIGRFWGVINRKMLPLAPLRVVTVHDNLQKVFFQYKRYAKRYWRFISRRLQSFYLFVNDADRWLALLNSVILS